MRAIVTGGTGFIGSHLVEALVARGDEVVCITRPGPARGWPLPPGVTVADCGFQDHARLSRALRDADVVFHVAGRTHGLPVDLYRSNTSATARLVRAVLVLGSSPPPIVLASSIAAAGPCRNSATLKEAQPPAPISRYGRSKLAAEDHVLDYAQRVRATILRLPSVYGPRERALFRLIKWVAHGFAVTIGSWQREASLIYVRDAVQGMLKAAAAAPNGTRLYYLAHPAPVTWNEFTATVATLLGRDPPLHFRLPRAPTLALAWCTDQFAAWRGRASRLNRDRINEISQERWVCDPSAAMRDLRFTPSVSLTDGLRETVAWYRAQEWL